MNGTTEALVLGTVVVGVDGSASARAAAMWAAGEAVRRGRGLYLVHATDIARHTPILSEDEIARLERTGRELLGRTAEAVAARHPGLAVIGELDRGEPSAALRHVAALSSTIVVGHRGRGGFSSLLLGSVGLETVANADTPVVVVRGAEEAAETGAVLAAVRDGADLGCARAAAREALLRKVPLRLVHIGNGTRPAGTRAVPGDGAETAVREGVENVTREQASPFSTLADRVREDFPELTVYADGDRGRSVPGRLVDASRRAGLLVVGGRRSPGHPGPALGRTTLGVVQHAHCPVELIPRHGPGHGSTS
ncbi:MULTISPECIES: universal stress protein [unclassified Streptomyces]|uniref:universal stress protein n=1 Tax=Streptomyces sp. NPDC127129 TaxID=3345373 RepID=UPI0036352F11